MADITKSILETITDTLPERDKFIITENRGSHVLASIINFVNLLEENFTEEESADLTKRLLNSIRTKDPEKFYRGLKHISENRKTPKV